jgi:DNA mismatch repair protein MutL
MENEKSLRELGFDVDRFGEDAVAVRQIPGDVEQGDIQSMLEDMCSRIRSGARADMAVSRDAILHSVACKAAIKAGKRSEPRELEKLVESVISGKVRYCPHGRPVAMELTKSALDRNFKRI